MSCWGVGCQTWVVDGKGKYVSLQNLRCIFFGVEVVCVRVLVGFCCYCIVKYDFIVSHGIVSRDIFYYCIRESLFSVGCGVLHI